MKNIKYLFQSIPILFLFLIFRLIGINLSTKFSGNLFMIIGPIFRANKICNKNLDLAFPNLNQIEKKYLIKKMWYNYGVFL